MSFRILLFLLCLLPLTGCEKIKAMMGPHVPDQKELDAQAIGYACRVSKKTPESCMKENDAYSPSQILNGWKDADKDIKKRLLDPNMNTELPRLGASAVTAASAASAAEVARPAETTKPAKH